MGLFKRNRQATERVQDLKNRVESLRKVDDEHRALTLDDFLAGDDTVTSRSEPRYTPGASRAAQDVPEDALQAELERYLQNHADDGEDTQSPTDFGEVIAAPGFEQPMPEPVSEVAPPPRPISIEEFPPLPPPEARFDSPGAPRLSAEDEATLIAELQRYLKTDGVEGNEDILGEPAPEATEPADDLTWPQVVDFPSGDAFAPLAEDEVEEPEALDDASQASEAADVVEIEGRTYEVPKPRHWPSVPLPTSEEPAPELPPEWRPRAAGDWEPL
jgi:hypothetical protein